MFWHADYLINDKLFSNCKLYFWQRVYGAGNIWINFFSKHFGKENWIFWNNYHDETDEK